MGLPTVELAVSRHTSICQQCEQVFEVEGRNRPDGPHPHTFCSRECSYAAARARSQMALLDRLADKFLVGDGCWPWVGAITASTGYGKINVGTVDGKKIARTAHRVIYELLIGPILAGLHIDHLCRVRHCVRPDHLEAVTQGENNRRAWAAKREGLSHGL